MKKKDKFIVIFSLLIVLSLIFSMTACTLLEQINKESEDEVQVVEVPEDNAEEANALKETMADEGDAESVIQKDLPIKIWVEDIIPEDIKGILEARIGSSPGIEIVQERQEADVSLEMVPAGGFTGEWGTSRGLGVSYVMALSTPFFNLADGLRWEDFKAWWSGDIGALSYISIGDNEPVMVLEERSYGLLVKMLGEPANGNIRISDGADVLSGFDDGSTVFSITPFDRITKEMKILNISGLSVFDRDLVLRDYPFAFSVVLNGSDEASVSEAYTILEDIGYTNRDISKMTSLVMTGVTAMVRGTAQRMENKGITYPGEKIADILKSADITHISNEVPFVEGCEVLVDRFPYFCSKPEYIGLLEYVGTDVVELTGNHMNDHGHEWFIYTLDMYDELGWPYYGGGRNLEEAYSPAILESNGNRFAFLGFNWWGPAYDWATEDSPGSAPPHFEEFETIIRGLKEEGYIVIFTFQYIESYQYQPVAQQVTDFRRMIDAGADIVSGSQSHQPQGMEFYGDGFINYGLGNLFFDQMREPGTRQELIAKHIFYEGNHINTVIITAMLEDYSQPRLASPEERAVILTEVFNASIR